MTLTNFHAASPICSPSRASIMVVVLTIWHITPFSHTIHVIWWYAMTGRPLSLASRCRLHLCRRSQAWWIGRNGSWATTAYPQCRHVLSRRWILHRAYRQMASRRSIITRYTTTTDETNTILCCPRDKFLRFRRVCGNVWGHQQFAVLDPSKKEHICHWLAIPSTQWHTIATTGKIWGING
jgi:hypothetical protein